MQIGKLNPQGKITFGGFQKILDFTATGTESSVSVSVDGDTDKEYQIVAYSPSAAFIIRLNNDIGSNYGRQYLDNASGTISAGRDAISYLVSVPKGLSCVQLLTPSGFIKTAIYCRGEYSTGTTVAGMTVYGMSYNFTGNVTRIDSGWASGGTFTAGSRITVYARRGN